MYGFQRLYRGLDKHAYYHRLFVRDAPGLTSYMERFGCKGTGPRRPAPSNEPNFYSVQSVAPPNCYLPPSTTTPVQYDTTLVMAAVMECCRMQNHDQAPSSSPLLPTSINMDHLAFPVMNDQKQPNKFNDELLSTAAAAAAAAGDGDDDDDDDHVGVLYEPFDIGDFMTDNSALFGQSLTEAQRKELLCNPFEEGFEW